MQKTPISPDQRLNIAAMILAGLQAPGYAVDTPERRDAIRESAIKQTDELIEACNCVVHDMRSNWFTPGANLKIYSAPTLQTTATDENIPS